jgi:hypothetical protein
LGESGCARGTSLAPAPTFFTKCHPRGNLFQEKLSGGATCQEKFSRRVFQNTNGLALFCKVLGNSGCARGTSSAPAPTFLTKCHPRGNFFKKSCPAAQLSKKSPALGAFGILLNQQRF